MMKKPNIAIIYFPGSQCETESLEAVKAAGMDAKILRWNTDQNLSAFDGFIIPGGWAYEDRIRAGVIPAKDPVMNVVKDEARKGKPVLGICNGAQILIETGIVPGLKDKVQFALAQNKNPFIDGYYNTWVYLKHAQMPNKTAYTSFSKNEIFHMPIAHGEGRFVTKEKGLIEQLKKNGQIIFQYCDPTGNVEDQFPTNPNGAMENIAALSNTDGNVLAVMPHPERAIWQRNIPNAKKLDRPTKALKIFVSMKKYIQKR